MNDIVSILGVQSELVSMQRNKLKGLNSDLLIRFNYYMAVFHQQELCLSAFSDSQCQGKRETKASVEVNTLRPIFSFVLSLR